jgi:hypothetical protein
MHRWLDFAGGLLVGFGLAAYVFVAFFAYMLHHMFIIGINQPFVAVVLLSLPAFSILMGIATMSLRRRPA